MARVVDSDSILEQFKVDIPTGTSGEWSVDKFSTNGQDLESIRVGVTAAITGTMYRTIRPGTYTRLSRGYETIMSDTHAEIIEHMSIFLALQDPDCHDVIINGLGIGMTLNHALKQRHIEHIDVVENSIDVIKLVGPSYTYDKRVHLHHDDARTIKFPVNTHWDVAWHDIWDDINAENVRDMNLLNRRYGHRVRWQECWAEKLSRKRAARGW